MSFHCIVFSADCYKHKRTLKHCNSDGRTLVQALLHVQCHGRPIHAEDFTRESGLEAIDMLLANIRAAGGPVKVLVVFFCHAYDEQGKLYFCPIDTKRDLDDIPLEYLTDLLGNLVPNAEVLGFFGTCRTAQPPAEGRQLNLNRWSRFRQGLKQHIRYYYVFAGTSDTEVPDSLPFAEAIALALEQSFASKCPITAHEVKICIQNLWQLHSRESQYTKYKKCPTLEVKENMIEDLWLYPAEDGGRNLSLQHQPCSSSSDHAHGHTPGSKQMKVSDELQLVPSESKFCTICKQSDCLRIMGSSVARHHVILHPCWERHQHHIPCQRLTSSFGASHPTAAMQLSSSLFVSALQQAVQAVELCSESKHAATEVLHALLHRWQSSMQEWIVPGLQCSEADGQSRLKASPSQTQAIVDLLRPMASCTPALLCSGTDDRAALSLVQHQGDHKRCRMLGLCNKQLTRTFPDEQLVQRGSCTSSTITPESFAAADAEREICLQRFFGALIPCAEAGSITGVFESQASECMKEIRSALANLLDLPLDAVWLSPSGTDACYLPFMAAASRARRLGGNMASVVIAPSQVGRGIARAAQGLHFNSVLPCGNAAIPGTQIGELGHVRFLPFEPEDGATSCLQPLRHLIDKALEDAVVVILFAVAGSKLGEWCPSPDDLKQLQHVFGELLIVAIDACQLRLHIGKIKEFASFGFPVLLTGSKFLRAPPFCGAVILPSAVSHELQMDAMKTDTILKSLGFYINSHECPESMDCVRRCLPNNFNIGLFLRWKVALVELEKLAGVSEDDLERFASLWHRQAVGAIASHASHLHLYSPTSTGSGALSPTPFDALSQSSLLCVRVSTESHSGFRCLQLDELSRMHALMTHDVSSLSWAIPSLRNHVQVLSTRCLLGLPVTVFRQGFSVLRCALSSDMVVELWKNKANLEVSLGVFQKQEQIMLHKLFLLAKEWDAVTDAQPAFIPMPRQAESDKQYPLHGCNWMNLIRWLQLSGHEILHHEDLVNRLWTKMLDVGISDPVLTAPVLPVEFVDVHVAGSIPKFTATRLSFDVDLTLITADVRPLHELRPIFLRQMEQCLSRIPGVSIQQQKPDAIALGILYEGLVLDLLIGRDKQAKFKPTSRIKLQPAFRLPEAEAVCQRHRTFIQDVLPEMRSCEAKMCMPTYGRMAVLHLQKLPFVVRECAILLKAWRHGIMMTHFAELLDAHIPDTWPDDFKKNGSAMSDMLQHRFTACSEVAPSCFLEQLALCSFDQMELRGATTFNTVDLFKGVLTLLADIDISSKSPMILIPSIKQFHPSDWEAYKVAMQDDAVKHTRPVVLWNPFNPRDDMARKISQTSWLRMKRYAQQGLAVFQESSCQAHQMANIMHTWICKQFSLSLAGPQAGIVCKHHAASPSKATSETLSMRGDLCVLPFPVALPVPVPVPVPFPVPVPIHAPTPFSAHHAGPHQDAQSVQEFISALGSRGEGSDAGALFADSRLRQAGHQMRQLLRVLREQRLPEHMWRAVILAALAAFSSPGATRAVTLASLAAFSPQSAGHSTAQWAEGEAPLSYAYMAAECG